MSASAASLWVVTHGASLLAVWACRANGGVYTKMGQYLASMNHVLPPVFTETLSVLQDKASHRSIQVSTLRCHRPHCAECAHHCAPMVDAT